MRKFKEMYAAYEAQWGEKHQVKKHNFCLTYNEIREKFIAELLIDVLERHAGWFQVFDYKEWLGWVNQWRDIAASKKQDFHKVKKNKEKEFCKSIYLDYIASQRGRGDLVL